MGQGSLLSHPCQSECRYCDGKAMRKKDPIRETRIHIEAIADAYGPEERALGWYYYL